MTVIVVLLLSIGITAGWMRYIYRLPWVSIYHSQRPVDAWIVTHVIWGAVYYLILYWIGLTSIALAGSIIAGAAFEIVENSKSGIAIVQWLGDGRFRGDSVANAVIDISAVAVGGELMYLVYVV